MWWPNAAEMCLAVPELEVRIEVTAAPRALHPARLSPRPAPRAPLPSLPPRSLGLLLLLVRTRSSWLGFTLVTSSRVGPSAITLFTNKATSVGAEGQDSTRVFGGRGSTHDFGSGRRAGPCEVRGKPAAAAGGSFWRRGSCEALGAKTHRSREGCSCGPGLLGRTPTVAVTPRG